jgi:hypothetical protein
MAYEQQLANVLESADSTTDYDTLCKIYSNIINNAELASRQISASDPLKKHWYKKVLQFQIKEKRFREMQQKQQ